MREHMRYDPGRHHRHSIRLKDYDYSCSGFYFITVCTWRRECLLGDIVENRSVLSESGKIVEGQLYDIENRFHGVNVDISIVMPNHVHAIIEIRPESDAELGKIIRAYKSLSAIEVNRMLGRAEHPLWQRNYYEHIIRSSISHEAIRDYINRNPANWKSDTENPINQGNTNRM